MEMEGIASIALLPSGSISGHFIHQPNSACFGLFGTQIACERECSRGEDYRLIKLTIFDYSSKCEQDVIVECRGQDAARFQNADHVHGWEEDVICMVEKNKEKRNKLFISFECETLKAENDAQDHIRRYLPNLIGCDAVVNIGTMKIRGLDFNSEEDQTGKNHVCIREVEKKKIDAELFIAGSATSCQSEIDIKCRLSDDHVPSSSKNEFKHSSLLGSRKQEYYNPEEDMIRQLLVEELQTEGIAANILFNKWEDSSSGWRIRKQVSKCTEE